MESFDETEDDHQEFLENCGLIATQIAINIKKRKLLLMLGCMLLEEEERQKRKRSCWVSPICQLREFHGFFVAIYPTLRTVDKEFINYFRMSVKKFDELLAVVGPDLTKKITVRKPISATERLCLCLRYLATGDLLVSFHYSYLMGLSTIDCIIQETCSVIWDKLSPLVLPSTLHENDWLQIAEGFEKHWNFPNAICAMDGKHIRIQKPGNAGSEWYNYKGYYSLVLLAGCDYRYKIVLEDIGAYGRRSDGGIFADSAMGILFRSKRMNVPPPRVVGGFKLPYVILADEAFPLEEWLMRPYPKATLGPFERIYNYRLSRARRMIENTFGILVSRWRIFRCPIYAYVQTTEEIVKACTCLHNLLIEDDAAINDPDLKYLTADIVDDGDLIQEGSWRAHGLGAFEDISRLGRNNYSNDANVVRNSFCEYFNTSGAVSWQYLYV